MIPTAEEWLQEKLKHPQEDTSFDSICEFLREFSKLHVQEALKQASEKVKTKTTFSKKSRAGYTSSSSFETVDKKSILNAYPLENIK